MLGCCDKRALQSPTARAGATEPWRQAGGRTADGAVAGHPTRYEVRGEPASRLAIGGYFLFPR
eukprot:scaffold42161_cov19-Tisochrysis_lutea.AAC.1